MATQRGFKHNLTGGRGGCVGQGGGQSRLKPPGSARPPHLELCGAGHVHLALQPLVPAAPTRAPHGQLPLRTAQDDPQLALVWEQGVRMVRQSGAAPVPPAPPRGSGPLTEVLREAHVVPEPQARGRGGRQRLADEPGRSAPRAQHAGLEEGKVAWKREAGVPDRPDGAGALTCGLRPRWVPGGPGWGEACMALGPLPASDPPASVPNVWSTGGCR